MIKAFEYRSGFGSEEQQLKPLNDFLLELEKRCEEYEVYTDCTGRGVLFYVEYGR